LQEIRWPGESPINNLENIHNDFFMIYTAALPNDKKALIGGVGLLIHKKFQQSIKSYKRISNRIIAVTLNSNPNLTIASIYAPVEGDTKENKRPLRGIT